MTCTLETFVSLINSKIDHNDRLSGFFTIKQKQMPLAQPASNPSKIPSLFDLAINQVLRNSIDLSQIPTELQTRKLNSVKKFSEWTSTRNLCSDEVVQSNSSALLKARVSKDTNMQSSDRAILIHLFDETVFKKCNSQEKLEIITHSRNFHPIQETASNKLREFTEKVMKLGVKIINNSYFKCTSTALFAYISWKICWKVIDQTKAKAIFIGLPLVINHVPVKVIKAATWIYDHKWRLCFGAWIGSEVSSRLVPTLNRWAFVPLYKTLDIILFFPYHLFRKTLSLTLKVSVKFFHAVPLAGEKIDRLNAKLNDFRFGRELSLARELWVNEVIEDRKRQRQEVDEEIKRQTSNL